MPTVSCQPEDFAGVCADAPVPGSTLCVPHLRGLAFAALDRRRWPRLRLPGGERRAGDTWRPWLREATGEELLAVLRILREAEAIRRPA